MMSGWQQERKYQTGIEVTLKNRRKNKDETGKTNVAGEQKMQCYDHHQPECGTVLAAVRPNL